MNLDENLLEQVDEIVTELGTSRSAFVRDALKLALKQIQITEMERQHAAGYKSFQFSQRNLMFARRESLENHLLRTHNVS